jgi:hypothetical protein
MPGLEKENVMKKQRPIFGIRTLIPILLIVMILPAVLSTQAVSGVTPGPYAPTTTWNVTPYDVAGEHIDTCPAGSNGTVFQNQFMNFLNGEVEGSISQNYTIDGKIVTVTLTYYLDNTFDFQVTNGVISTFFVKSGVGLLYQYEPPVGGATNTGPVDSDTGLHDGYGSGYTDISHVEFCLSAAEDLGCLNITKEIEIGEMLGDLAHVGNATFSINVTGPSYPSGHIVAFNLTDGVLTGPEGGNSTCLCYLIPGNYTVSEIAPDGWEDAEISPAQPVLVDGGDECDDVVVTVTNSPELGSLEVTKEVDFGGITGAPADVPAVNFTVTVTGPSYPLGHNLTFHLIGGNVTYDDEDDATACMCDLIPGNYTVSETPPVGWHLAGEGEYEDQLAVVAAGTECGVDAAEVYVPNVPTLGCLEVTKEVDFSGIIYSNNASLPVVDFIVTVTGPSYPLGHNITFHLDGGVVVAHGESGPTACLYGLIPGDYYVTEDPPDGWEAANITNDNPAVVVAGECCYDGAPKVIVENTPIPGCLEVTKVVDLDKYPFASSANATFNITVTGPSYPMGLNLTFEMIDGEVIYVDDLGTATACLCGLIPGNYTVTETPPDGWGAVNITNGDPAVVVAGANCAETVEVIVENTPDVGCLEITKEIDDSTVIDGAWADLGDALFSVNVTGPSYPSGEIVTFNFTGGALYVNNGIAWVPGDTYCLCELIPGNYTATEDPVTGWECANITGSPALVEAGDECGCDAPIITVTNSPTPGCLEVTKEIDWSGIIIDCPGYVPAVNFTVTVTGPSYPLGHNLTFHLENGVVEYEDSGDATACLCGLIPGNYTVTETPPAGWEAANITNGDPAVVVAGTECDDGAIEVIVENTPIPGCLEVTKEVDFSGIEGDPADVPAVNFTVTVEGPSYPAGNELDLIFHLVDGVVEYEDSGDATACLCGLIPGNYTVTETPPAGWEAANITNGDPAVVVAGTECDDGAIEVIVENTPIPGCLEVTKEVDFSGIEGDPADVPAVNFTVTVMGPSYPLGHNLTFHLVDGVVEYDDEGDPTACLCGLIPGNYTVTETPPAGWEAANITNDDPAVVAAGTECGCDAIEVIVENTPDTGCLEIEKVIDMGDMIGALADVEDATFTVEISGPSYPSGCELELVFELDDGDLYVYPDGVTKTLGDSYCICDLIPGNYTAFETQPEGWGAVNITGSPALVEAGDTCGIVVASAAFGMTNPGFEFGDFTGWTVYEGLFGSASVVTSFNAYYWYDGNLTYYGPYFPYCGDYFAVLEAGNVTEDTYISQDFTINAGETIEGRAFFSTEEQEGPTTYNDECSVDIMDGATLVEQVFFADVDTDYPATPWTYWSWTANATGTYTLLARVVNVGDGDGPSFIGLDICDGSDGAPDITVTNTPIPGCLNVTKEIDIGDMKGDLAHVGNATFSINVTGPSYPDGHILTFNLTDGVLSGPDNGNSTCLCHLIPGNYTVAETPPDDWILDCISPLQPVLVDAGDECDDVMVTVTNRPRLGCLVITKDIDWGGIIGNPADVTNVDFIITITGPSYPAGHNVTFNLTDGELYHDGSPANTACLCSLIPGNYTAVETPPAGWAAANITGSPALVEAGDDCHGAQAHITVTNTPIPGCLEVTKVVDLDEYPFAGSTNSTFTVTVGGPSYPCPTALVFELVNGDVFYADDEGGDTACLCGLIPGNYTVAETPPAGWNLTGITPPQPVAVEPGTACNDTAVTVNVTNRLLLPHTTINVTADFYETTPGGNVWLHICDTNDGEVPLTDPYVELWTNNGTGPVLIATLNATSSNFTGDYGVPYVMDVGETWCWDYQVTLWVTTNITVIGHGTDPWGNPVDGSTYPGEPGTYPSETDTITVRVGGATRTWGFWKTHMWLVNWMLDPAYGNVTLPINLGDWGQGSMNVTDNCTYMALMWANQASNSDGGKRAKIDAARIHTAQQALAAIMNDSMAGGASLLAWLIDNDIHDYPTATDARALIADILTDGNEKQIRTLGSVLAGYNESGEGVALDPSLPPTGKTNNADPQGARDVGATCETYWDTPTQGGATSKGGGKGKNK